MKYFVQHPYKERIELNIGAITQIVVKIMNSNIIFGKF